MESPTILRVMCWPDTFRHVRRGHGLVLINRHSSTVNLVRDVEGSDPLIKHAANTVSVAPPSSGPAGCRPLHFLYVLDLSFRIRVLNRC